jgi:hypothetical protein
LTLKATLSRTIDARTTIDQPRAGWTIGRLSAVVVGSVLALSALALIIDGGYLLSAATSDGGWLKLGHGSYATDSYAVVTEPEDWSKQNYVLDNVEKVRVRVTPSNATTPVFVGMAKANDVERYLHDIQHVTVHGADNYHVTYTQHDGGAPTMPPAEAIPWTVQSTGTGTRTLEFKANEQAGDQVLVVMNADGSASVSGKAESSATQPSLPWIASGLLAGGVIIAALSAFLIIKPIRRTSGRS